ncbi:hypothetical protein PN36_00320 [Candidatus Thiomargarita nelsonii]|uniref:GTPase n=1 Tax=Candidatus Thiomargarita nelsonii TaxID=1003181 RepID=A0A0A6PFU9_9GAMM|nr:hypothetical protein PN36_00320 [Candidatus Thiomargarita nelsonii]
MDESLQRRTERAEQAHNTVKKYTLISMGIAAVPFPLVDLAAVTGLQIKMVHSIANQYEVPFSHNLVKSLVAALTGGALSATTAVPIASLVKVVPFIGQVAGFVGGAVMFGATSYAIGKVFIEHFESGGTFLDFDPENMKAHFQKLFEEGQELATASK